MSRLPWPVRRYGKAYLRMPDGSEIELTPMDASLQLKEWASVVGGLAVFQATNIKASLPEADANKETEPKL